VWGHATGRLLAGVAAAVVAAAAWLSGALAPLENASVDARFGLRRTPPVTDIVVVGIDERSISELGVWPFRRLRHAQAVDRLRRAGARDRLRRAVHGALAARRRRPGAVSGDRSRGRRDARHEHQ